MTRTLGGIFLLGLMLAGALPGAAADIRWFEDTAAGPAEAWADPNAARMTTDFYKTGKGESFYRMGLGTGVGFACAPDRSWSVEGRAAVFTRFNFLSRSFNLETADFIGGLAWRQVWDFGRTEAYVFHDSAHWGGDVFPDPAIVDNNLSREVLRILVFRSWGPLTAYAGPRLILRSDPAWKQGKAGAQIGAEFRQGRVMAGLDAQIRGEYRGDTDVSAAAGISLSPDRARFQQIFRVFAAWGHPAAGQLEDGYETRFGLGMMFYDQGPLLE